MQTDGGGLWKWVAAMLSAILLAGAPGMVYALKTPSSEEVKIIRERQDDVRIRLAIVEAQLKENAVLIQQLREEIREHVNNDGGR